MQIFLLRLTLFLYTVTFWVLKNTAGGVTYTPLSGTHQAYIFSRVLSQLLTVWAQGWVWLQSFYLQAPCRYDVSHVFICKFLTKILQLFVKIPLVIILPIQWCRTNLLKHPLQFKSLCIPWIVNLTFWTSRFHQINTHYSVNATIY